MPYERVVLGPCYAVRPEDLRAAHAVMIECVACWYKGLVAKRPQSLRWRSLMQA